MKYIKTPVVSLYSLFSLVHIASTLEEECGGHGEDSTNAVEVFVSSKRNETAEWVTDFLLSKDDSDINARNNVTLALSHDVTDCKGRRTVHIRGVISGLAPYRFHDEKGKASDKLLFHTKCGTNVAVLNDGRTLRKINLEVSAHGVAFTRRPLKINEILEVKLEKKHNKFGFALAIGLSTLSPKDASQPEHINSIKNTSWAWYNVNIYYNGNEYVKNYGKNLNTMEVGERIGVMRSNTGSLHFYWNGVDQGPAASNIPDPVYGVVELYGDAAMATIV